MQVNYGKEHTFFSSQTHTFPKAIESKKKVVDEIDRDLLGAKADRWNPTVAKPKSLQDKTGVSDSHNKFLIRTGFADETFTEAAPQTTYAGTDTRDVYYHGWDVSYECTPPRDKERQYQMERTFFMEKTKKMTTLLTSKQTGMEKTSHGVSFTKYTSPEQITGQINQKIRVQKSKEMDLWEELL